MQQAQIDQLRTAAVPPQHLFIGGRPSVATAGARLDVVSPIDGRLLTTIADGDAADVDLAVRAARQAFDKGAWSRAAPAHRKKILLRFAELVESHALELAVLGVRDNGTEIKMAYKAEPLSAAGTIRYYAEAIDKVYGEIAPTGRDVLGLIHREPLGVVGVIVPWNFPMMIGAWKIAPALAAGNSVVVKPPEIASLTLLRLAQLASEAGLPDGVLNVVTGRGATAGEALGLHMDVDAIAFTGSGATGRRLLECSARSNLKRVYLELGGKSPNVIFADAPDLKQAAQVSANGIFRNSGQVCVAGSRLIVQSAVYERFMEELLNVTAALRIGDPLQLTSDIGAISSPEQLRRNLDAVALADREGATRLIGGEQILAGSGGNFMTPAIFGDVTHDMNCRARRCSARCSPSPGSSAREKRSRLRIRHPMVSPRRYGRVVFRPPIAWCARSMPEWFTSIPMAEPTSRCRLAASSNRASVATSRFTRSMNIPISRRPGFHYDEYGH
jgi:4-(gamma-glutamylamino)butanal dehydrogenase